MPKCLIVFFALLGLASAVKFSVPLRSSGSLKEKMVREGRYSEYLMQRNSAVRQNLVDTMDEFYVADIALGTPGDRFQISTTNHGKFQRNTSPCLLTLAPP